MEKCSCRSVIAFSAWALFCSTDVNLTMPPDALAGHLGREAALIIIDVRSPDELTGPLGHIREATNMPLNELPAHLPDHVLDVNLKGSCFCAQYVAQTMIATGRPGSIVNISSGAALRGSPRGVHYAASKGGVLSLTRAMALERAPHRIRVNAIAPGLTDTAQPRYGSSEAEIAEMARAIPLGRMAQPDEIARAAVFLASDNAGFITGQTLHVNGGSYLA
jgi:NAD(P)-dependent dehydrogenase (short-subunit alcohol dehydrogenase family)